MSVVTYEELALGWRPDNRRDRVFNIIAIIVLVIFTTGGMYLSSIPVPKQKRERMIPVPERIARFISERPKPKPKPRLQVTPIPPPPLPPQFRRKRSAPAKPLTKVEKKARKKAESSGLLALTKQLSDLMDTQGVDKMVGRKLHRTSASRAASVDSTVLTAAAGKGNTTVSQNLRGDGTGTGARLDNNQRQLAQRLLASHGEIATHTDSSVAGTKGARSATVRGDNLRSEEDVAYIMDRHKSMLHSLYRRARRTHPGLKGKIVLEITILPSGKVSKIRIVSSELHDKSLERDLVSRIKLFDFGAKPVETLTLTIPVEFLPS